MPGFIGRVRETLRETVQCPSCTQTFDIEYNPHISESFYHVIMPDGERKREISILHIKKGTWCEMPLLPE